MKPVQLISFRRSGTHLMYYTLMRNFDVMFVDSMVTHTPPESGTAGLLHQFTTPIYLYRDGRDAICSLLNYFKDKRMTTGGHSKIGISNSNISVSQFLRGEAKPLIGMWDPQAKRLLENPAAYWAEHTQWLEICPAKNINSGLFSVKFEDMKTDPEIQIIRIAQNFNWDLKHSTPVVVKDLVGPTPQQAMAGRWRKEFSKADLEYFWKFAGKRMVELGYQRGEKIL